MGLKTDISKAFKKSGGRPTSEPNPNIDMLSADLEKAIEQFILKQEFRVVKLKSEMDVENIKTSGDISVDVAPETLLGPHGPVLKFIKKIITTISDIPGIGALATPLEDAYDALEGAIENACKAVSEGGSTLPSPDMKKDQKAPGKGGALTVKGTSNIKVSNYKTSSNSSGLAAESAVVLYKGEVKGKG